jgi:hypothetical protein
MLRERMLKDEALVLTHEAKEARKREQDFNSQLPHSFFELR